MPAIDYLLTCRAIEHGAFQAEVGSVQFLEVPRNAAIATPAHIVQGNGAIQGWVDEIIGLADGDENPHSISPKGDILVFIHGYNNDLKTVLWRQRQLTKDLDQADWHGIVIGFDWPSGDETLAYLEDRSRASQVAIELVRRCIKLISRGQEEGCVTNIHLLGHSTGAYVVMEAFAQAQNDGELFKSSWRIGQVAFIGGDVASSSLASDSDWAKPMYGRIMRLTNYSNGFDSVLAVSNAKRLGTQPRAGRVGLPANLPVKAVNVDCSDYFEKKNAKTAVFAPGSTYCHSWHIGDPVFTLDFAMTMEGAFDRNVLPTRKTDNSGLKLQPGKRPAFQGEHDTKPGLREGPLPGASPPQ